eukprot:3979224-Heterocapsa_arctica.AAC.1
MAGLSHRPYLTPISKLVNCKPKPDWTPQRYGMLKAIVSNGMWEQQRLWAAGLASGPNCLICDCPGTAKH